MKRQIVSAAILAGIALGGILSLAPVQAFAGDAAQQVCAGIGVASGSGCDQGDELSKLVGNIINIFSLAVGIVAVIMIIIAGFKYITANGDSGNLASAKQTLIYAIVGLIIAALSQALVRFVLENIN